MMMMMSLQPNPNYSTNHPNVMPLRAMARKASVDEADPDTIVEEGGLNDELAELEKEDKLQEAIKTKRDAKKKAENAKKEAEAKKSRQALFKKIGIGVGAVAGTVVTAGLGLGLGWYYHKPNLPVTGDDMIRYASSLSVMSTTEKNNMVKQFQHLELDFKKGESGIKEAITGFRKAASMSKTHKDRTLQYMIKEGGFWDFLTSRDVKFKKTMANITGEIFANKEGQRNVAIFSSISDNMTAAKVAQEQSGSAIKKKDAINYKYTVLANNAEGNLTAETRQLPVSTSIFEAATTEVEKLLADTQSITDNNVEGLNVADYLPNLKKSITETLNPLLKQQGLGEVDVTAITEKTVKELGSGTVAKVFSLVASDGKTYAAKVVHPAVNKEVFPNILNRYILDLQLNEGLSHADAVLKAMQKLGNLAQETDLAVEHKVHQHLYENYEKGFTSVAIHKALGLHNTATEQVMFQEQIQGLEQINKKECSPKEKAVANIRSLNQMLCGILLGNMHGDPHPGNIGFDADGNTRMLDFGKNIFLAGETPKHIRGLMLGLLGNKNDLELLSSLKLVNTETFNRLTDKQKTELLNELKSSPFSMAEMLFKYHFLNQPENINANYAAFGDMAKLNTTLRTSAGIYPHTNYYEGLMGDIKARAEVDYDYSTHLYGKSSGLYENTYQDEATDYMPTYLSCAKTFLKTLCQDNPAILQDTTVENELTRKYLDHIAAYSPGRELTVRYLPLLKEEGINIDYAQHVAAGVENIPLIGEVVKGQINKDIQRDMDKIKKPREFDPNYVRPITLPSQQLNQSV